jgi:REP element-mobilizing transposase RayT
MWSRSYYISSVGSVSESTVKRYIAAQKTHA